MDISQIPQHLFISYASDDLNFAEKLASDLQNIGIDTWMDRTGITPGSPNWEETIRQSIVQSFGVILIATGASRKSKYVNGEISVAHDLNRPILPVWADGTMWSESVPLAYIGSQYIDLRGESYSEGMEKLKHQVWQIIDKNAAKYFRPEAGSVGIPHGYWLIREWEDDFFITESISGRKEPGILIRYKSYKSVKSLLDDLYIHYLRNRFQAYRYFKDWLLVNCIDAKGGLFKLFAFPGWSQIKQTHLGIRYPSNWLTSVPLTLGVHNTWYIVEQPHRWFSSSFTIAVDIDLYSNLSIDMWDDLESKLFWCIDDLEYCQEIQEDLKKSTDNLVQRITKMSSNDLGRRYAIFTYGSASIELLDDQHQTQEDKEILVVS